MSEALEKNVERWRDSLCYRTTASTGGTFRSDTSEADVGRTASSPTLLERLLDLHLRRNCSERYRVLEAAMRAIKALRRKTTLWSLRASRQLLQAPRNHKVTDEFNPQALQAEPALNQSISSGRAKETNRDFLLNGKRSGSISNSKPGFYGLEL